MSLGRGGYKGDDTLSRGLASKAGGGWRTAGVFGGDGEVVVIGGTWVLVGLAVSSGYLASTRPSTC